MLVRAIDSSLKIALLVSCALAGGCPQTGEMPGGGDAGGVIIQPKPTPPQGSWKTATTADTTAAGFETLLLADDGTYTQTGRTDGEAEGGSFTQPASIPVDPSFGNPPAGIHGPYMELSNNPQGDGQWDYSWAEATDGSTLTITLYAQRFGMGLRWATPTTINLVAN